MRERQIYLLSPKTLSPEVIAVAFAKTSRSPESFREIAAELTESASAQFHERWVVGYGHASVAEHAVLHIAVENASRLALECLESNRLASYTEKSTRYQMWGPDDFYVPGQIAESGQAELYRATCRRLFSAYERSLGPAREWVHAHHPRRAGETDAKWDGRVRSKYVDNSRFLLPAAALANVGVTANARTLEAAIRKLLSHPLAEVREIGAEIKRVAQAEVPTLVKYADAVPYQIETAAALTQAARSLLGAAPAARPGGGAAAELVDFDPEAEAKFLAACLYRHGHASLADCRAVVAGLDAAQRADLAREALGRLGPHDVGLRELEHVTYTFDLTLDQGGYFEIKRHRMMTLSPQPLTATLGYATPRLLEAAGFGADYRAAMDAAAEAYAGLAADFPEAASYVVPNGFNRRVLVTLNLRQAFHLCELRSAPNAHFSVRRTAGQMAEAIRRVHPGLAQYMRLAERPDWRDLEAEYFSAVA